MNATAIAHPNIALVKYWGKRDRALNLPAAGSLSLTLGPVRTRTRVEWGHERDQFTLDGAAQGAAETAKLGRFLDIVRASLPDLGGARVVSDNNFPTAAGLASSSSAYAALAMATTRAAGLELSNRELSVLARRGSGSAARSIFGGVVRMNAGRASDGLDAFAEPLFAPDHWPLRMLLAVTVRGAKSVSSRDGMNRTQETSPYFGEWVRTVDEAIREVTQAISDRDFHRLAVAAEASAMQMHASAIASVPSVLYWRGATVETVHAVRRWRGEGLPVFFTIDAGPHVKVCTTPDHEDEVERRLSELEGVSSVIRTLPASGVRLESDD